MPLAPIALFVYNRLSHTKQTVEALQSNLLSKESELYIFADGPKSPKDYSAVEEVRKYLKTIAGFKSINIIHRPENFGLAKSIISGVTEIVNKYGNVIVLEDDLVTAPYFLKYMNDALDLYENDEAVASIHGYIYPVKGELPETFFIKGADCWGWGTWKRAWSIFEPDGKKLLNQLRKSKLTREFDFGGTYPYTRMLESQILGLNNSWAIRWYASAFLSKKLTLYPGSSLVKNIGMDATGVHSKKTGEYDSNLYNHPVSIAKQKITEDVYARKLMAAYFSTLGLDIATSKIKFFAKKIFLCLKNSKKL